MKLLLLAAALLATTSPSADPLGEAAHAIAAGRLDQARIMVAAAIKNGAKGEAVERLLADLAFRSGDFHLALGRYEALLKTNSGNAFLAERAGIAAIKTGDLARAAVYLERATESSAASWRAWNARGVVADHDGNWNLADLAYSKASTLKPDQPEVVNNLGWSLLIRGSWAEAVEQLERAAALDPASQRIADNLDLARTAVNEDLPRRRRGERESDWAARLNDAGVIARVRGDKQRAIAAFARAIEARSQWFERAANNLALLQAGR